MTPDGGRQERKAPAADHARCETPGAANARREAWRGAGANWLAHRRQLRQQPVPGRRPVGQAQPRGARVGHGRARAGEAVAEAQHPDPAAVEDVVEGGIVHRIRRDRVARKAADPSARHPRSACRATASAAAIETVAPGARARAAGSRAGRSRRPRSAARTSQRSTLAYAVEGRALGPKANARRARSPRGASRPRPRPPPPGTGRRRADTSAVSAIASCGLAATSSCRACSGPSTKARSGSWWKKLKPRFRPQPICG